MACVIKNRFAYDFSILLLLNQSPIGYSLSGSKLLLLKVKYKILKSFVDVNGIL